jgi:hypothetical protein
MNLATNAGEHIICGVANDNAPPLWRFAGPIIRQSTDVTNRLFTRTSRHRTDIHAGVRRLFNRNTTSPLENAPRMESLTLLRRPQF